VYFSRNLFQLMPLLGIRCKLFQNLLVKNNLPTNQDGCHCCN